MAMHVYERCSPELYVSIWRYPTPDVGACVGPVVIPALDGEVVDTGFVGRGVGSLVGMVDGRPLTATGTGVGCTDAGGAVGKPTGRAVGAVIGATEGGSVPDTAQ